MVSGMTTLQISAPNMKPEWTLALLNDICCIILEFLYSITTKLPNAFVRENMFCLLSELNIYTRIYTYLLLQNYVISDKSNNKRILLKKCCYLMLLLDSTVIAEKL